MTAGGIAATGAQALPQAGVNAMAASAQPTSAAGAMPTAASGASAGVPATTAPAGPPAWNAAWQRKFVDAGVPSDVVQQLVFSGGGGYDAQQLQHVLDQTKAQIGKVLSEFHAKYPHEYAALSKSLHTPEMVQLGVAVQQGQITRAQLAASAATIGASNPYGPTPGRFDSVLKQIASPKMLFTQMLPWTFIPGWGALRVGASLFNHGKDPLSGEKIHYDFWRHGIGGWLDFAMFAGGATSVLASARQLRIVSSTLKTIDTAGGTGGLGAIAAREGVAGLHGFDRVKAYLPRTHANAVVTGLGRYNELERGIQGLAWGSRGDLSHLPLADLEKLSPQELGSRGLAELVRQQWVGGKIDVISNGGFGMLPFGWGLNQRGAMPFFGNRSKPMASWQRLVEDNNGANNGLGGAMNGLYSPNLAEGRAALALDPRLGGESLAAHIAKAGVNLVPRQFVGNDAATIAAMERGVLAQAGQELTASHVMSPNAFEASPFGKVWNLWRPGAKADVLKAMARPSADPTKLQSLFANKWVLYPTVGIVGGGGMFLFQRHMQAAAQKAADQQAREQAKAQRRAQRQQGGGGAASSGSLTATERAGVAKFAALPADQQLQFLATQRTAIASAASQTGLTADQQRAVQHDMLLWSAMAKTASPQVQQALSQVGTATSSAQQAQTGAAGSSVVAGGPAIDAAAGSALAAPVGGTADTTAAATATVPTATATVPAGAATPAVATDQAALDAATAQALAQVQPAATSPVG